jgi:hypothetical protein
MPKIHRQKKTRVCYGLRVAGKRGRALKNRGKKTVQSVFTSQLATRNSQPSPPGSKKLAVDLGCHGGLIFFVYFCRILLYLQSIGVHDEGKKIIFYNGSFYFNHNNER